MPPTSPPSGRFQFSIGRILWAMFVCALVAAAARAMNWPVEVQAPLVLLLMCYALYAIFRLPYVVGDLRGRSARWHRIHQQRAELQQLADERRKAVAPSIPPSPPPVSPRSDV